ncbi:MAG TPA: 2-oxoacid:acceptor oxidoreductase family protein [archaeon]|nr:2-oxoacid:acceptor oxidoreductase family protein [archaeon]
MKKESFNIVVCGIGGQGVITLGKIISRAAMKSGLETSMSEFRGHAKRHDSTHCHIRIGKAHTPVIPNGNADLIIAMDSFELLRQKYMIGMNTQILMDGNFVNGNEIMIDEENLPHVETASKNIGGKIIGIGFEALAKQVVDFQDKNIFFLGAASRLDEFPVHKNIVREAIIQVIAKRVESSLNAFDAGFNSEISRLNYDIKGQF